MTVAPGIVLPGAFAGMESSPRLVCSMRPERPNAQAEVLKTRRRL